MARMFTRIGDSLLARLVPQTEAHADHCSSRWFYRLCYCSRGLRYSSYCRRAHFEGVCAVTCQYPKCQIITGTC